jgi:hypothetical protein
VDLSLRYEDNETAHDDVFLRFAGETYVCDSYYFSLDRALRPGDESPSKVKAVVHKLLEQWLTAAANLPDSGEAFLPYDFSDQYTGWLCCQRRGNEMDISKGYALVEGHSLFPSVIGEYLSCLPGFCVDGPTIKSSREGLLQAIRDSLAKVA